MVQNPYESPRESTAAPSVIMDFDAVKRMVRGPAISLAILSIAAMFLDLWVIANAVLNDGPKILDDYGRDKGMPIVIANIGVNCLVLLIHLFVLIGAVKMYRVNSYAIALTAAILALIPFCSPVVVLGIPFGVWAIIVLSKFAVKMAFQTTPR